MPGGGRPVNGNFPLKHIFFIYAFPYVLGKNKITLELALNFPSESKWSITLHYSIHYLIRDGLKNNNKKKILTHP